MAKNTNYYINFSRSKVKNKVDKGKKFTLHLILKKTVGYLEVTHIRESQSNTATTTTTTTTVQQEHQ